MLVVDKPVKDESNITRDPLRVDDYIWPHGITPPLRHVRKRRFRKRLSRQTIEVVEEQVEDLLKLDAEAENTQIGMSTPSSSGEMSLTIDTLDAHPDPDIPDEWYENYDAEYYDPNEGYGDFGVQGSDAGESEFWEDPGSAAPTDNWGEEEYEEGEFDEDGQEDDFDA